MNLKLQQMKTKELFNNRKHKKHNNKMIKINKKLKMMMNKKMKNLEILTKMIGNIEIYWIYFKFIY